MKHHQNVPSYAFNMGYVASESGSLGHIFLKQDKYVLVLEKKWQKKWPKKKKKKKKSYSADNLIGCFMATTHLICCMFTQVALPDLPVDYLSLITHVPCIVLYNPKIFIFF